MIGMSTILAIKQRAARGDSVAQIAREEGISEPTVRKYRDMDDFSPQVKPRKRRGSKLDPFKATIDRWLAEDNALGLDARAQDDRAGQTEGEK